MTGLTRGVWLVVGLATVVGGSTVILVITGVLGRLLLLAGTSRVQPAAGDSILPSGAAESVITAVVFGMAIAGVVLVGLAAAWLWSLRPRRSWPADFRLHREGGGGRTIMAPAVLEQALRHQVEQLPGVVSADVSVAGAVQAPHLRIRVTADERSDLTDLVSTINKDVGGGLALAFDGTVDQLSVLVDLGRHQHTTPVATLA